MSHNLCRTISLAALAGGFLCSSAVADVLFQNTTTDLNARLNVAGGVNANNHQIGDEIILSGPAGVNQFFLNSLSFQYWGTGMGLSANAELFIYANDGPLYGNSPTPGTLLFDSGPFQLSDTTRSTVTISSDFGSGLLVPKDFTYAIRFTGLTPTGAAGVDLYNPPTVGTDFNDYWYLNGTTWELRTDPNNPANFAAQILGSPVPEPTTLALLSLGGLVVLLRRKFASN